MSSNLQAARLQQAEERQREQEEGQRMFAELCQPSAPLRMRHVTSPSAPWSSDKKARACSRRGAASSRGLYLTSCQLGAAVGMRINRMLARMLALLGNARFSPCPGRSNAMARRIPRQNLRSRARGGGGEPLARAAVILMPRILS